MIRELTLDTATKGKVSAMLQSPDEIIAWLVLAHGAGANMQHGHMQSIADALANVGIATLRFNFPYMEGGGGRVDSVPVCVDAIEVAIRAAISEGAGHPLLVGGHSFGGRMSSHFAVSEQAQDFGIDGLVYFSFPLHPASKPDTRRADHMHKITLPQLFLSGTRDKLADLAMLQDTVSHLTNATLHELDTADHSFKILKRSRASAVDVYDEAAAVVRQWLTQFDPQSTR